MTSRKNHEMLTAARYGASPVLLDSLIISQGARHEQVIPSADM
jgi:hypothetical protein